LITRPDLKAIAKAEAAKAEKAQKPKMSNLIRIKKVQLAMRKNNIINKVAVRF